MSGRRNGWRSRGIGETPILDPALLASTPYQNFTALIDAAGILHLYHRALAETISATTGKSYRTYPLGDGRGTPDWLWAVQQTHVNAAAALGIAPPPDLASFDLSRADDHASFFFLVANDLKRLRNAAGLS